MLLEREWLLREFTVLDRRSIAGEGPRTGGEAACGRLFAEEARLLFLGGADVGCWTDLMGDIGRWFVEISCEPGLGRLVGAVLEVVEITEPGRDEPPG